MGLPAGTQRGPPAPGRRDVRAWPQRAGCRRRAHRGDRDLSGYELEYLFLDAIYETLRQQGGTQEALLCAWGILRDGRKVLLHLALGQKERYQCWLDFLRRMVARGLRSPLTITSDGAPGVLRAIEEIWPQSLRLRCWVHTMRNVLDKIPDSAKADVKAHVLTLRDAPTLEAGRQAAAEVLERYSRLYPSAMASLSDDLDARLNHLHVPVNHRRSVRTTDENVKRLAATGGERGVECSWTRVTPEPKSGVWERNLRRAG